MAPPIIQSKFIRKLGFHVRASYPFLYVVTDEPHRLTKEVQMLADTYLSKESKTDESKFSVYHWDIVTGWSCKGVAIPMKSPDGETLPNNPNAAFAMIEELKPFSIYIMENFHFFLTKENPELIQSVINLSKHCNQKSKTVVFMNPIQEIPAEIAPHVTVLNHDLPTNEDINNAINSIADIVKGKLDLKITPEKRYSLVESLKGMRLPDMENALSLSLVEKKDFDVEVLHNEKCEAIKKTGTLEYIQATHGFDAIGGCDNVKSLIRKAGITLSPKAKELNLDPMKAFLFLGVPGCCKSELIKACGPELKLPVVKMDLSRMFGSLVGQSEHNIRAALKTLDSMAPCIAWIDEFDKGMSGVGGSGSHDGGTTVRVGGVLLTWMNDHTSQVIVMCSANDVSAIPPEYLRKGRFSEIVFFDIPSPKERTDIFRVQFIRQKLEPTKFDIAALVDASGQFTGAEIMAAISDAKITAAYETGSRPTTEGVLAAVGRIIPEAKKNKSRIESIRSKAASMAVPASLEEKSGTKEVTVGGQTFREIDA